MFRERYAQGVDPTRGMRSMAPTRSADYEEILCQANYKSYRRFEAAMRIK
jgi:hypothetical protein